MILNLDRIILINRVIQTKRFRAPIVRTMIQQTLTERLDQAIYDKDQAPGWAHEIAEEIKKKLLGE